METEDTRILLRGDVAGEAIEVMVEHPEQPADYVHTDGTVWTWEGRVRLIGGVEHDGRRVGSIHLRVYDLVTPGGDQT